MATPEIPRAAEVFSGGGLFALAFAVEGFDLEALCELDTHAVGTLRANFGAPDRIEVCDARDFDPPDRLDVLFGGPPCQPYSRAGHRRGPEDPKHRFDDVIRYLDRAPRVFVWENVPGVMDRREPLASWRSSWWRKVQARGYQGTVWRMQAADYGTPQSRDRVFFVGWQGGAPAGEVLARAPRPTHARWGDHAIEMGTKLPWVGAPERLAAGCCGLYGLHSCAWLNDSEGRCGTCWEGSNYTWGPNEEDEERTEVPPGVVALMEAPVGDRGRRRIDKQPPTPLSYEQPPRPQLQYLAPTMTASLGKGAPQGLGLEYRAADPEVQLAFRQLRYLSVGEAAKLQDVPQWYRFVGPRTSRLRQIGNGVPVNLGRAVARHVLRALGYPVPVPGSLAADPHSGLWPIGSERPCAPAQAELLAATQLVLPRTGRPGQRRLGGAARGVQGRVERLERSLAATATTTRHFGLVGLETGDPMQANILDARGVGSTS